MRRRSRISYWVWTDVPGCESRRGQNQSTRLGFRVLSASSAAFQRHCAVHRNFQCNAGSKRLYIVKAMQNPGPILQLHCRLLRLTTATSTLPAHIGVVGDCYWLDLFLVSQNRTRGLALRLRLGGSVSCVQTDAKACEWWRSVFDTRQSLKNDGRLRPIWIVTVRQRWLCFTCL